MTDKAGIPQIFDPHLRELRRARAVRRMAKSGVSFFLLRALDDVAERMLDVNRRFENVLLIGPFDLREALLERLPAHRQPDALDYRAKPDGEGKVDIVVSLLDLQSEADLPGALIRMGHMLKPDGLMIAAMFGGQTLSEFRQVLYAVDEEQFGGVSARVYPMITHSVAAPLLTRAGLNLPVVDMDRFTVRYSDISRLVADLRDLGETNILTERSNANLHRAYQSDLARTYQAMFGEDGKLPASFEIVWLTGWKPHDSQQKPLKPGSAKMRLADALKTRENKL